MRSIIPERKVVGPKIKEHKLTPFSLNILPGAPGGPGGPGGPWGPWERIWETTCGFILKFKNLHKDNEYVLMQLLPINILVQILNVLTQCRWKFIQHCHVHSLTLNWAGLNWIYCPLTPLLTMMPTESPLSPFLPAIPGRPCTENVYWLLVTANSENHFQVFLEGFFFQHFHKYR